MKIHAKCIAKLKKIIESLDFVLGVRTPAISRMVSHLHRTAASTNLVSAAPSNTYLLWPTVRCDVSVNWVPRLLYRSSRTV